MDTEKNQTPQFHAKQIAEEIGSTRQSVANYLNLLKKFDLVETGKRTKTSYYELGDFQAFASLFKDLWIEKVEESALTEMHKDMGGYIKEEEGEKKVKQEFLMFLRTYIIDYFDAVDKSNLEDMLTHDFVRGLVWKLSDPDRDIRGDLPRWLLKLKEWFTRIYFYAEEEKGAEVMNLSLRTFLDMKEDIRGSESS